MKDFVPVSDSIVYALDPYWLLKRLERDPDRRTLKRDGRPIGRRTALTTRTQTIGIDCTCHLVKTTLSSHYETCRRRHCCGIRLM